MFRTPIGTHDSLPAESARRQALEREFNRLAELYGFGRLETPIFEASGVFRRLGEGTDVVRKEMYDFKDKGGRDMALRPEGTAAVCRAFIQHNPLVPWKVTYGGPFFRYEAPQAGRFRQFHQLGAETLGTDDPDADVEIIALAHDLLKALGLRRVELVINSMGDNETISRYMADLGAFMLERYDDLDPADQLQSAAHPMRVLDSKQRATREVTRKAPKITEALNRASHERFEAVKDGLTELGIRFRIEPRLVRGLDYYRHTTFEFKAQALRTAQDTVCGGGRYDGLIESLVAHARRERAGDEESDSGPTEAKDHARSEGAGEEDDRFPDLATMLRTKPTGGVGFALGVERLLLACDAESAFQVAEPAPQVWVVDAHNAAAGRDVVRELREAGIAADRTFGGRSMRAQMKVASRSGAKVAVIVGDDELAEDKIVIRILREEGGSAKPAVPYFEQLKVPRSMLLEQVHSRLNPDTPDELTT